MTLLAEILRELRKMFLADARMSLAALSVVAGVALLLRWGIAPVWGGALLLAGCVAVLVVSVRAASRR